MGNENNTVGRTKYTGYQVGARKTIAADPNIVWEFLTTADGLKLWLGRVPFTHLAQGFSFELPDGTHGRIRVLSDSHVRLSWQPPGWLRPSIIQLRVIPSNGKSVIAFHQEHLPGPDERNERKAFYKKTLETLERILTG